MNEKLNNGNCRRQFLKQTTTVAAATFISEFAFSNSKSALNLTPNDSVQPDEVEEDEILEKHVMIPMRDGVKLSAYLYFPSGKGPWPVLLVQRYYRRNDSWTQKNLSILARGGYVAVLANFRGSQLSEGVWQGYRSMGWGELRDGFDLVEWLGTQTWSTGKVGTFGSSQAGFAQNFLAITQPPHLVAQYMIDTGLSLYQEGYRRGGGTNGKRLKAIENLIRVPSHNQELLADMFRHPNYDTYWADEDCTRFFNKMNVPCFTIGSWYDYMCAGSVESYIGRQHRGGAKSRGAQKLLIGPWLHGEVKETNKSNEMNYPETARFSLETHMLRWFDYYLKGIDNGVITEPTIRYYVMGAMDEPDAPGNYWRSANDWPLPAESTSYYLHADKKMQRIPSVESDSRVSFLADPLHPAECLPMPYARDARGFEQQPEVLTFTTDVLADPVEWTGKVRAKLFVSSDSKDTDLIVRVSDVYPDGRSILIMDSIRRARYRKGFDREVFMDPGNVYKLEFDIGWFGLIFNKGHQIRVTIASTCAPFYVPNSNTGEPISMDPPDRVVVANNVLHVSKRYASKIIAPVMSNKST